MYFCHTFCSDEEVIVSLMRYLFFTQTAYLVIESIILIDQINEQVFSLLYM